MVRAHKKRFAVTLNVFREIRACWRILQVIALVFGGIAIVRLLFPFWSKPRQRRIKQAWSARLVATLGVRIDATGPQIPEQTLIVSNHISWLDVFVINALTPATFVCKDDVKSWPAIGWLVEHTGTLFIERGSRAAAARSAQAMTARFGAGERVAIFPEGTTTQGTHLLPFRAALFEAAVSAAARVQPLALQYQDAAGQLSRAPAYDGDISFGESMLAIVRSNGLKARLQILPLLDTSESRRELALASESSIAQALGFMNPEGEQTEAECAVDSAAEAQAQAA